MTKTVKMKMTMTITISISFRMNQTIQEFSSWESHMKKTKMCLGSEKRSKSLLGARIENVFLATFVSLKQMYVKLNYRKKVFFSSSIYLPETFY